MAAQAPRKPGFHRTELTGYGGLSLFVHNHESGGKPHVTMTSDFEKAHIPHFQSDMHTIVRHNGMDSVLITHHPDGSVVVKVHPEANGVLHVEDKIVLKPGEQKHLETGINPTAVDVFIRKVYHEGEPGCNFRITPQTSDVIIPHSFKWVPIGNKK